MNIRLMVDGGDQRIRITPTTSSDKKLLGYIAEWDIARLKVKRQNYSDIEQIDLVLEMEPKGDAIGVPEIPNI